MQKDITTMFIQLYLKHSFLKLFIHNIRSSLSKAMWVHIQKYQVLKIDILKRLKNMILVNNHDNHGFWCSDGFGYASLGTTVHEEGESTCLTFAIAFRIWAKLIVGLYFKFSMLTLESDFGFYLFMLGLDLYSNFSRFIGCASIWYLERPSWNRIHHSN